jgi:hypothetical protein
MSDPSSSRYRFNAGDTRRARLKIEPTAMMTGIVVLAHAAFIGNAIAATEYAVDGLAVGTQLNLGSTSYREYINVIRATNLWGLYGARRHELRKNDEDLTPRPIHSYT